MGRGMKLRRAVWGFIAVSAILVLYRGSDVAAAYGARAVQPNVVLVQVDDLSLKVMRSTIRQRGKFVPVMPKTKKLIGDKGTSFTRFYANSPICAPSRASMLSGLSTHNHGMRINAFPYGYNAWQGTPRESSNLATWLDGAGYRTSHIGKFMNGYTADSPIPPGWDNWITSVNNVGAPYYAHNLNVNGEIIGPIGAWPDPDPRDCLQRIPPAAGACTHANDVHTAYAAKEIRDASDSGEPFFLQLDLNAPHDDGRRKLGPEPPTRYRHLVSRVRANLDMDDRVGNGNKPYFVRDLPKMTPEIRSAMRIRFKNEVATMRAVDDSIGRIVSTLRSTGELSNTYVAFFSDNGFFQGEHRIAYGKFLPHEPSTRQPLVVRGPGIPAGSKTPVLASTVDIAPTVMSWVGGKPASRVDGGSVKRFAEKPELRSDRVALLEGFNGRGNDYPGPFFDGLGNSDPNQALVLNYTGFVAGRWKYIRYYYGDEELYDLKRDPSERWNLARSSDSNRVLNWSRRLSSRLESCSGASCKVEVASPQR